MTPEKTGETTAAAAGSEAASAGATRLLPAREEQGDVFTVRGRVLKSDGQPAAGARVSIVRYYFDAQSKRPPVAKGQAGPQGEFELSYRKSQIVEAVARPEQWKETSVVAEATGFGLEWAEWGEIEPSKPFTLRLVGDVPIHGRVVDLQGRPVAGVRLIVGGINAPKSGTLDAWLDAVKKGATPWVAWPLLGRNLPPLDEGSVPPVTTDHDGRFTLTGIGAERVANLELRGDTVAYKNLTVATRAMSPLTQEHLESDTDRSQVFGKDFTFEAFPSQPIVGTVRDAATGQPLAGVGIESWLFAGTKIGGIRVLRAETDQKGSYRLVGMPRGTGNKVLVLPNDDQPYFMRELTVPPAPGSGSATLDIELHRGLWIIGRVTDRVTGDPVLAYLHYLPFRSNSDASRRPEFDANGNVDGDQHRYRTRTDGSFRIPGMPGRAIVGAEAILASYRRGYGAQQIKGKDKNGYFATWRNPISATTKWPDALVEINPPKTAQAVACDLTLDPGESVRMHVVDPVGKPVSGCQIQGRRPSAWDLDAPSTFEVVSLVPGDMRTIVIRNDKRSLGKFVVLKFDEKTPRTMTVQLEPTATFAGRLLDEDGAPLKGITLEAQPLPGGDFWPRLSPIVCQPDGTFEYKEIPSGCRYSLLARGQSFGFATAVKEIAVEPGKTARLGDIKLKRRQ